MPTWAPLFMGFPSSHSTWEAFSLDRQSGFSCRGERRRGQFGLLEPSRPHPTLMQVLTAGSRARTPE